MYHVAFFSAESSRAENLYQRSVITEEGPLDVFYGVDVFSG